MSVEKVKPNNGDHQVIEMSFVEKDLHANGSRTGREPRSPKTSESNGETEKSQTGPTLEQVDPWALPQFTSNTEHGKDLSFAGKLQRVGMACIKMAALLALLYFFVCSLDVLSVSFRLLGGRATGEIFQKDSLLQNPVVGVMIGILTTVLVQSSSTSTSIVVSMVAAEFLTVPVAIPIVMGANIGSSVTNTIVSLTQMGDRNEFRRAFAAATVHDMFNWLTVIVLFVIEISTRELFGVGYLEFISEAVTGNLTLSTAEGSDVKLLNALTEPLTIKIVKIDKKVIEGWSKNDSSYFNASLIVPCKSSTSDFYNCSLFARTGLADWEVGVILLIISLAILCGCLVAIVKVLNSMLQGQMANVIRRTINAEIPYIPWITGYLALVVGAVMTFLVQSSSVFTSALTPLVGVGVISLERVYPLTLGSNIGTTTTSLIAALAAKTNFNATLRIALCHFFLNITGILLFFPIPWMRFPVPMAQFLGDTTAKYRWFSMAYLILMFFVLPALVLGLSVAGTIALAVVGIPILIIAVFVVTLKVIQTKWRHVLPEVLRDWNFVPLSLRSLEPMDNLITTIIKNLSACRTSQQTEMTQKNVPANKDGVDNPAFQ